MNDIRWIQRFQNFEKSYGVLKTVIKDYNSDTEKISYKMAMIQAFEVTFELSWKVLKDYLYVGGIVVNMPRDVIKEAFSNEIIKDGQAWIEMLDSRNSTAHEYDDAKINEIVLKITNNYEKLFAKLYNSFKGKI